MTTNQKMNILMVDDQPAKLLSYEAMLGELGDNLIRATSGREALDRLLKTDIAVMLMDVSMPGMDGFEVADMVRQHPRFQKTAIIFISAVHLTDLDRIRGYERGAVDYIAVPIVPELLRAKVSVFAELHRKTRELEKAETNLRQLTTSLMRTQDEERRHIARELHDGLGQSLVAIKMMMGSLRALKSDDAARGAAFADIAEQVDLALNEARTMSYLLHPPLLDEIGLTSALEWYTEGFSKRSGISVDLDISPTLNRLGSETELTIFRVVQECLTNIHRHSGSPDASIRLIRDGGTIRLDVRDSGKGMPQEQLTDDSESNVRLGIGIRGMRERIRQLQGCMDISSGEGSGTVISVSMPDGLSATAVSAKV